MYKCHCANAREKAPCNSPEIEQLFPRSEYIKIHSWDHCIKHVFECSIVTQTTKLEVIQLLKEDPEKCTYLLED